jgi:transcriptional regulator with XRE-family HTH domain
MQVTRKHLANAFVVARRSKGLSQEKLAEIAGLHVNTIHCVEAGKRTANADTMMALSDALEIRLSKIMRLAENNSELGIS